MFQCFCFHELIQRELDEKLYTITIIGEHIRKENAHRDDQNCYTISRKPMVC